MTIRAKANVCLTVTALFVASHNIIGIWNYIEDKGLVMRDLGKPSTDEENNEYYRIDAAPQNTTNLPFLDNYRNPCWRELSVNGSGTRIRCLPYFYLVGAPKSGTTDLHRRLTRHPLISSLVPKEPHWLGRQEFFKGGRKNLSDYLEMFDLAVAKDITQIQHNGYFPAIFGDCSASTLWDRNYMLSDSHGNLPSPIYTNAEEIYHLNPNAKIIIILRNPIKRLFSEYLFFKEDLSKEDFHSKVVYSVSRYRSCLKAHSEWYCAYYRYQKVRLHIGLYCIFIEDYMRVFPRDQIKVLKLENYSNNIPGYLADVFRFLQIGSKVFLCQFHVIQAWKRWIGSNKELNTKEKKYILGRLRHICNSESEEVYHDRVRSLKETDVYKQNRKLSGWLETKWFPEEKR